MSKVRTTEALQLGVEVGEVATLQQRIIGEVDSGHDVLGAERDLLSLREEVVDAAVKNHPPDLANRHFLFGNDLGRVENVESKSVGEFLIEQLQAQLPFGEIAGLDGLP